MTRMIQEAGLLRSDCRITNVCKYKPPANKISFWFKTKTSGLEEFYGRYPTPEVMEGILELEAEIDALKPDLIIAFGAVPLWALTGMEGIGKWRGSCLETRELNGRTYPLLPTYHPAAVLRMWEWRFIAVQDLRRAKKIAEGEIQKPEWNFKIRPTFAETCFTLDNRIKEADLNSDPIHIACDIETIRRSFIDCIGIAWNKLDALCIPFIDMSTEVRHYWTEEEEAYIIRRLSYLLTHKNVRVSGQNWFYDAQYFAKFLGIEVNLWRDTMTTHHVLFAGLPKSLDFQSSLYLDYHRYWKDEGKDRMKGIDQLQHWEYNCKDCVSTWEIAEEQTQVLEAMKFKSTTYGTPYEIQQSLYDPVFSTMLKGVRVDTDLKLELINTLLTEVSNRDAYLERVLGKTVNTNSPKQLRTLFYDELGQRKIYNHKSKSNMPTCNADALTLIAAREPLLEPIVETINESRQIKNALAFCLQPLDQDRRIRCSYSTSLVETYRFSSSADAFGFGTNLQNITEGEDAGSQSDGSFGIPNLRKLFIPDTGKSIGDFDLAAADAQVVAADAGDYELLEMLRDESFDLHNDNAKHWNISRRDSKTAVHATDYYASSYSISQTLGISKSHAQFIIDDWYRRRPKIKEWHDKILQQLMERRYVENAFGYRRFYFGRIDTLLKEALAWIPQSTVAIVTNLGILNVYNNVAEADFLLQVHDSAVYQWPTNLTANLVPIIKEQHLIPIPYEQPLTISVGAKISTKSWGDCK